MDDHQRSSLIARGIIIFALIVGCAITIETFRDLAQESGSLKSTSTTTEQVITPPSGEIVTSVSGVLKLLIAPSTNATTEAVVTSSDVVLLPVQRSESSPVVLPYIASLVTCVIVICAFIWGIVRIWRED